MSDIIGEIRSCALFIDAEHLDIDLPDPKDRVFYEVVIEAGKNEDATLVTGNIKHFPAKAYIVTPRQLLDLILEGSNEQ